MKPSRHDKKYKIHITGIELAELKKQTWAMTEAYGLDMKIENYKGARPITFYYWDLDCLLCVVENSFDDYSNKETKEYLAMKKLFIRLFKLYPENYHYTKNEQKPFDLT